VASVESVEPSVSEAIRGEESVKRPACDWCGDMPGRLRGGGLWSVSSELASRMRTYATKQYEESG
jgi:hypothetical protein